MDPEEARILDEAQGASIATDDEGRIAHVDDEEALLGGRHRDPVGAPLTSLMPERMRRRHLAGFARYRATHQSKLLGRPVRVPALLASGEERDVDLTLRTFRRPDASLLTIADVRPADAGLPEADLVVIESKFQKRLYQLV